MKKHEAAVFDPTSSAAALFEKKKKNYYQVGVGGFEGIDRSIAYFAGAGWGDGPEPDRCKRKSFVY